MFLDTHVLVRAMPAPELLSRRAHEALGQATECCASAGGLRKIA